MHNRNIFFFPQTTTILFINRYWCTDHEERCSEIIASLLTSKYPINSPNKRKRPLKSATNTVSSPTSEQVKHEKNSLLEFFI